MPTLLLLPSLNTVESFIKPAGCGPAALHIKQPSPSKASSHLPDLSSPLSSYSSTYWGVSHFLNRIVC